MAPSVTIPTPVDTPTDHRILLAVQRQVAGLVAEKAAQQAQIDALVLERDAMRTDNEQQQESIVKWITANNAATTLINEQQAEITQLRALLTGHGKPHIVFIPEELHP